ncbi:helix-turn-helix domain-containing protein [Streptomyces agglomeratus]|uniref:helix-turn-helix domain-containing protein n=1 Tax=Streptomyces agglomeratus TaxID=285458 RepID=UPI003F737D27
MLPAPAGGNRVPVIARLVAADENTVRDAIHRFNEIGLACLDPRCPSAPRPRSGDPDRPRGPALPARPTRGHLPAHKTWKESTDPERDTNGDVGADLLNRFHSASSERTRPPAPPRGRRGPRA